MLKIINLHKNIKHEKIEKVYLIIEKGYKYFLPEISMNNV